MLDGRLVVGRTGTTASIVSSEIARGLDIFELTPSAFISQNEIDAAKTVHLDYLNAQGQPKFVWPPSFALARAYVDQLERSSGLSAQPHLVRRARRSPTPRKQPVPRVGTHSTSWHRRSKVMLLAVGKMSDH